MKNLLVCLAAMAVMVFVVSCGGNNSNNSESNGQECSSSVFRCDGSILQKCINETWKNYIECQAGETCNAEKGECEIETGDDNSNSPECTAGEFKCVGDESYYCDRGNSLVFDSSCENGCDPSTGECRENSSEPTNPTEPTDPTDPTNPTEPTEPTTGSMDEGIYFGIIGFNQSLYVKDIGLLSNSTLGSYTSFIDNLASGNGTALYYADYTALDMLRDYQMPPKLKSVVLVTFTDGLDNMSIMPDYNPENYGSQSEYRDAIHNKIVNEKIHGKSVAAYTIGLNGSDVSDDNMFFETLNKLSSSNSNVFQVSDIDEVNELFKQAANAVYSVSKTVNLGVDLPGGYNNGQLLRFTFDNPGTVADSNLYIEATYSRSNGVTLDNISYHGFLSGQTTISSESSQGYYYHLVFEDLKYDNGNPISDMDINRIMLWTQTSTCNWNTEVEFDAVSSITITEDRNSALIMLVLDCTTSLGVSDFAKMQQAGKDFVNTLINGSGSAVTTTPCDNDPCADIANLTGVCTVSGLSYICDCNSGYDWNGSQCVQPSTPCNLNLCTSISNSNGSCTVSGTSFICGCNSGYTWNGLTCASDASYTLPECSSTSSTPCRDSSTGYIWSEKASTTYTWQNAVDYCNSYSEGGYTDWRLPNIDELRTLLIADRVENKCQVSEANNCLDYSSCWSCEDCIQTAYEYYDDDDGDDVYCDSVSYSDGRYSKFGENGDFWSSSSTSDSADGAWVVGFYRGDVGGDSKSSNNYVRCVR